MPNFIILKYVFLNIFFFANQDPPQLLGMPSQMLMKLVSFWNGFLLLTLVEGKMCHIILHARSATHMQVCVMSVEVMSGTSPDKSA